MSKKKIQETKTYSLDSVCDKCGLNFPLVDMKFFSFNHPSGACEHCHGLGFNMKKETLDFEDSDFEDFEDFENLDEEDLEQELEEKSLCSYCQGSRLNELARSVYLKNKNLAELTQLPLNELYHFLSSLKWNQKEKRIAEKILEKTLHLISSLQKMGLSYLSLGRATATLSGGEAQRARLAAQLGSELIGVLYVLDEPSIGLHPKDHRQLLSLLRELQSRGNTLVIVEHDLETILAADHLIDLGPGAGQLGGHLITHGHPQKIKEKGEGLTAKYLRGEKQAFVLGKKRGENTKFLSIYGAKGNNLKNIDVHIPLERLVGISGVSGSGKSTLIMDTLYVAVASQLNALKIKEAPFKKIKGMEFVQRVIKVDQRPIGRTSRSIPATYTKILPLIRQLFAGLPESRLRGYTPSHFSFNSKIKEGRCPHCKGLGVMHLQMKMLSDTTVVCEYCEGKRFRSSTLNIKYRNKSIADILNMSFGEALDFFKQHSAIFKKLELLNKVGLSYLRLGQVSSTLSGGEAQRIKLSRELGRQRFTPTLYILDEPTTGLHFEDIRRLLFLLHELVDEGSSVIVIEHNLDVLMSTDHIIDLGPIGGTDGGYLLASGSPQEIMKCKKSFTGKYLFEMKKQNTNL